MRQLNRWLSKPNRVIWGWADKHLYVGNLKRGIEIVSQGMSIAQVVYSGLHIITPLISLDLLKYPKRFHDYFSLLSHMLEVYPEMIAQLSIEAFAHIMGTLLDFGLRVQDSDVVDMCLRATKALAAYHYKDIANGKTGLGLNATGFMDASGKHREGFLSRSLPYLLQFLLFEDYGSEIVSAPADALLPLFYFRYLRTLLTKVRTMRR